MPIEFAQKIRRIPAYPVADGYDLGDVAMLASNEAPFGPLEPVVEAATRAALGANRYPDPSYLPLRKALADRYGIPWRQVALGCGSCDILLAAGEALLEPGAEVVYGWPSFSMYPHLSASTGARAVPVPLTGDAEFDLDAMLTEVTAATRLVIVCNPNNPTGTALPLERIEQFIAQIPSHVCVILDEAYIEFSLVVGDPYASLPLLRKFPNLALLRTFSKVYGLAGLRVGYALCGSEAFRTAVEQVRQPFYLTGPAQAAAVEALKYQDEVDRRVESVIAARITVTDGLTKLGLWAAQSDANFIWVKVDEADDGPVLAGLKERGVLVRSGSALGGPGHMRVTLGTDTENSRLLQALAETLQP